MPFSILDLDDVMLEAKVQLEEIFKSAEQEFYGPVLDTEISQMWQDMPDQMKMLLKQVNPEEVKRVDRRFGGK